MLGVLNAVDHMVQDFVRRGAGRDAIGLRDRVLDQGAHFDGQDERRNQDFRRVVQIGTP